jgi:choline dehydrogenase-like flavoprotein
MQYDYIVVGGGSAGCVTAGRLVAEYGARVLLLEAGPLDDDRLIHMPAGFVRMLLNSSRYVFPHESVPQPHLDGRTVRVEQGAVLGGGSSVNAMTYMRGTRGDYDRWNDAVGGGWGWDDLLPYFRRQEGNQRFNSDQHGIGGPLKVSDAHHPISEIARIFLHTLQAMGVPYTSDFNGGDERGVGLVQSTTYRGVRCSASDAFLSRVRSDTRLDLKCDSPALRVLFEGNRATGIEYRDGRSRAIEHASAREGIILTAGAYITPKLLMLSGIGPAGELFRHGIAVRLDLPGVGQNMQDHNDTTLVAYTDGAYGYFGEHQGWRMLRNGAQYLLFGSGPVASTASEVCAFVDPTDLRAPPTMQFYCGGMAMPVLGSSFTPGHGMTMLANLVSPASRGRMSLRSADPAAPPLIDPNWLSAPEDVARLLAGLRFMRKVTETSPMRDRITRILAPAPDDLQDAALIPYIRRVTKTNFHPVGSCRMGRDSDPMAVLTPDLRVRGVEGLRVFDSAMMPSITSANTNATVMAVADHAVDLMMGRTSHAASEPAGATAMEAAP